MLKPIILIASAAALGTTILAVRPLVPADGSRAERTSDTEVNAVGATKLDIQAPIASITLETKSTSQMLVHAVRWTKNPNTDEGRKWLNAPKLTADRVGDVLSVNDQVGAGDDVNHVMSKADQGLDLHITVPRNLRLSIKLALGTTSASGYYQSINCSLGAGHVLGRFVLTGSEDSSVKLGAGQVELFVPKGSNMDLRSDTGVGDISGIPADAGEKKSGLGERRSARIGDGGPYLDLHVGAGSISVNSAEAVHPGLPTQVIKLDPALQHSINCDQPISSTKALAQIGPIIAEAMKQVRPIIRGTLANPSQTDHDLSEAKTQLEEAFATVGPALEKALRDTRPEFDQDTRESKIDRKLARQEIDKAFKQARPEIERAMARAREQMKQMRPEIERAFKDAKIHKELEQAKRDNRPEIERALKQAREALEQASRKIDHKAGKDGELEKSVMEVVRRALQAANESLKQSQNALKESGGHNAP